MEPNSTSPSSDLIAQYRNDRRKLLNFILSSNLITQIEHPSAGDTLNSIDLDSISADYVLDCVNSGEGVVDVEEARRKYRVDSRFPLMIDSPSGISYFLTSEQNLSGSPPRRTLPKIEFSSEPNDSLQLPHLTEELIVENFERYANEEWSRSTSEVVRTCQSTRDETLPSLGLPVLFTGLSDDDLRQTAFEMFLGSVVFSRFIVYPCEDKKEASRLLSGFRSRRDKSSSRPQATEIHSDLLNCIRVQMQISEAMEACIIKRLTQSASVRAVGQIVALQVPLELLGGMSKYDFPTEKLYIQWKKRQVNIIEEILCSNENITSEHMTIKTLLATISNHEEWDLRMSASDHMEVLLAIRRHSLLGSYGYHLNIQLYEKLLCSVFDILDESQLLEESEEILRFIEISWAILGITRRTHDLLYGWVLFKQFVGTGESMLLDYAVTEIQKFLSNEDGDSDELEYIDRIVCVQEVNGGKVNLSLPDAVFLSMSNWSGSQLQDYHLYFSQKPIHLGRIMALVTVVGLPCVDDCAKIKLIRDSCGTELISRHIKDYIGKSIEAVCTRLSQVLDLADAKSRERQIHPLVLLADKIKFIAERESTTFSPVLRHWCPEAGMISSALLHRFYGEKLKPFLSNVSHLSEYGRSVLSAAYTLDLNLTQLYYSAFGERKLPVDEHINHYKIEEFSSSIILEWVSSKHRHILEWTDRALHLEEWKPLSFQQRQAASIVEVFRIIEETVNQFFGLNLPMDDVHLRTLLAVISESLEGYVLKMVNQLVENRRFFPATPALTRFKDTMLPIVKKKPIDDTHIEEKICDKLKDLTVSKLCVRLNTLEYIENQIGVLEDSIRKSWGLVGHVCERWRDEHVLGSTQDGKIFALTLQIRNSLDKIRKSTASAISKICDFIGTRAVFFDMKDSFLLFLYQGNVDSTRLESVLPQFDDVLDHICSLISDTLRDQVVLSFCRAALDGYVWVLLDGGPSRAFSDADVRMMQEDLNLMKEFFVAEGDGLLPAVVEKEAGLARQILGLYSLQTENVIELLMVASEQISTGSDCRSSRISESRGVEDAQTLLRILCHKKDREASKFLKLQYQLPPSSDYKDTLVTDSSLKSPLMTDLIKRSASLNLAAKSQRSFRSMKKKLQSATSDIMQQQHTR